MSRMPYWLAALLLCAATSACALTEKSFRAFVVSVDASTKTIRFRVPDDATPPTWSEVAAIWDDTTKWEDAPEKVHQRKSAGFESGQAAQEGLEGVRAGQRPLV